MLIAIATGNHGIPQHDLSQLLGVTSATICRMLKSLEDLGYILRSPLRSNPRRNWVALTPAGALRVRAAGDDVVDTGALAWAVAEMLDPDPGKREGVDAAIEQMDTLLTRVRRALFDVATLRFFDDIDGDPNGNDNDGGGDDRDIDPVAA